MSILVERLQTLRVADAMCARVVDIPSYKTMADAAAVLLAHQVSAAPVVDEQGRCIGLISTKDFVKCVAAQAEPPKAEDQSPDAAAQVQAEQRPQIVPAQDEPVTTYMTAGVQSITAEAPLVSAARMMCVQHYHRLLVLDASGRPVGVISTMDVVQALVNLADEAQSRWPSE